MKICYLLETTDLWGGVRIVFDQARGLIRLGHQVTIRALGGSHLWYPYPLHIGYVENFDMPFEPDMQPDVVICTYWSTVRPGIKIGAPLTVHLCQGYEGDYPELKEFQASIEDVYRIPIPKITIGHWLSKRLSDIFGSDLFQIFTTGQVVDTHLFKPGRFSLKNFSRFSFRHNSPPRILVVGDWYISWKGVADALQAVSRLREKGESMYLIRVSLSPPSDEEKLITPIDESYVMIPPRQMASVYRNADLLLATSLSQEGFGLPFAEALASGLPAVATAIPSYLSFDKRHDYACFVNEHDPDGVAGAALLILRDHRLYSRLQRRGPKLIRKKFSLKSVARNIEAILFNLLH